MKNKIGQEFINHFSETEIMIVGDVMLDRYWFGKVERISPEAPVPVVRLEKSFAVAGGAANVAGNIAGLGGKPILIGAIGNDSEAAELTAQLKVQGINPKSLVVLEDKPTIVKTRIVAHNHHVVRLDQENDGYINKTQTEKIWKTVKKNLPKVSVIIISDYAKGVLTEELLSRLITSAIGLGKKIIIDPKGKSFAKYSGATLLTPNLKEAFAAIEAESGSSDIETVGKKLLQVLKLESLIITRGEDGMSLFLPKGKMFHLKSAARKVYDVTGAGDTVIAVLGLMLSCGVDIRKAAEFANIAAGLVVEEVGTTVITKEKLFGNQ